ncbi:MAG: hypothetical protein Q9195_003727 [Heterodermia aff. obscurata]
MDVQASFTHLAENVPSWLSKLETLSAQVAEQHAKFSKLTTRTENKLALPKSSSTESLRRQKEKAATVEPQTDLIPPEPPTSYPLPSTSQATANDVLAVTEARRKRKPGSALSLASGPQKYRQRTMIIVYYNSDIQEAFELLVRNIAGARNNLRKGRTAASFKKRLASLSMDLPPFSAGGESGLDFKIGRPLKKTSPEADDDSAAFDAIDKDLENAQILCERAAHQMLREGDCKEEILGTKNSFQSSLKLAQQELDRFRAEEVEETPDELPTKAPVHIDPEIKTAATTVKPIEFAGIGSIEVDDRSDVESFHIDLSAMRRTRRV